MTEATPARPRNPLLQKLAVGYRSAGVVLLNTVLLFLFLNLVLFVPYALRDKRKADPYADHSSAWLTAAFPGLSTPERNALLAEHWAHHLDYEDYIMFRAEPFHGKYLNVSEHGFRLVKDQGPWPPAKTNLNVFVFGGSTMFGTGMTDEQTVPSRLQEALSRLLRRPVCVYNFAVGFYYSTQERLRFERLLVKGLHPDAVIFVDGLNDFIQADDTPAFHDRFEDAFRLGNGEKSILALSLQKLPLARLVHSAVARMKPKPVQETGPRDVKATGVISRYLKHKEAVEAICRVGGITPLFVWQPVPCYGYDLQFFPWYDGAAMHQLHPLGYAEMRKIYERGELGQDFVWLADLAKDEQELIYIDSHHYTEKFCRKLAEAVADEMVSRKMLTPP